MKLRLLAGAMLAAATLPNVATAAGVGITPGLWDITVTTESMEMGGMPTGVPPSMRGKAINISHCVTPADAAKGPQEMLKSRKACTFDKLTTRGNVIHAEMTCTPPVGGGTMHAVSDTTFTPTGFTSRGRTVMTGGAMAATMVATTVGKRVGACPK